MAIADRPRVGLALARMRATALVEKLEPYADRILIVGSVRREKRMVADVEILLEPKSREGTLFGDREPIIEPIRRTLSRFGALRPDGDRYIRMTGTEEPPLPVDVFLCHPPATWGALSAIRTGPGGLSRICVTKLRHKGWRCDRGRVLRPAPRGALNGDAVLAGKLYEQVETDTEEAFFEACEVPFVPAAERDEFLRRLYGDSVSNGGRP